MKVRNVGSNMTEVEIKKLIVLVSYQTPVACKVFGEGFYKTSKKWSVTTSRHINKWLGGAQAQLKNQSWFDSLLED